MRDVLCATIRSRAEKTVNADELVVLLGGERILLVPHAIPAALSIGPAKEMVGQPFLYDHEYNAQFVRNKCGGPLHIIACQKTATELQAIKLLGFPDATVISAPFGMFVADNIQKVQFAFIVNCRDETTTRYGTQRFFTWLEQSGEEKFVAKRAKARAAIVQVIAENIKMGSVMEQKKTKPPRSLVPEVGFSPADHPVRATRTARPGFGWIVRNGLKVPTDSSPDLDGCESHLCNTTRAAHRSVARSRRSR